jgi:1-deoxy-D-xylulose-5-phosphate reductoisomerase
MVRQTITLLGATGSVGRSAIDVVRAHPDRFAVEAVVGGRDAQALASIAIEFGARFAAIASEAAGPELSGCLAGTGIASGAGSSAILDAVQRDADIVLAAISGAAGLRPTHAALRRGRRIALANKETLVCAGTLFMADARRLGAVVTPVDSEHNALAQALAAGRVEDVSSATITASGGPFRTWPRDRMARATPAEASRHPTYAMGAKINIDSATLMNKGLELIEAHHLFELAPEQLEVLVHPQSIVHAMVHWSDGVVTAALANPDMRVPIANSLAPDRERLAMRLPRLDLAAIASLTFEPPDEGRFPCLGLARHALREGGARPTVLNAANEIAVEAFLAGRVGFLDIAGIVEATCDASVSSRFPAPTSVEEAIAIDEDARRLARERLPEATSARREGGRE